MLRPQKSNTKIMDEAGAPTRSVAFLVEMEIETKTA